MSERSREAWEVSLAFLQDRRNIATIGAHCNGCGDKHRWPIEDLIVQHKPWTTVSELQRECGPDDAVGPTNFVSAEGF
jgi:hypothetical protein